MPNNILINHANGIARITLNRPEARNALTDEMCRCMSDTLSQLKNDRSVRVLIIDAAGTDFTVGADLKSLSTNLPSDNAERGKVLRNKVQNLSWPLFKGLDKLPQPIIASVRGHCIGAGAQMLLSADMVVASETLKFLIPQVRLAHSVDHGESYFLPRKVGMARAMQLTLLAETLNATDAEKFGLVNWVTEDNELEQKTTQIAQAVAAYAPVAAREIKTLMKQSLSNSLTEQFLAEAQSLEKCAATEDFIEALQGFKEKRKPKFTGK